MKLAVFDFDGTLYPEDTLPFLLKQWKELNYSKARLYRTYLSIGGTYMKYKISKGSRDMLRKTGMMRCTRIFSGMNKKDFREFLYRSAEKIVPKLNDAVVGEVKKAKASGYHTVLLSGCYETFLKYVGESLDFDTVLGTKVHYTDGRIDLKQPMQIISGDEKHTCLTEYFKDKGVDWKASCAYGDSDSDIKILELVGKPVAVNPDRELMKKAQSEGWKIMNASSATNKNKPDKKEKSKKNSH